MPVLSASQISTYGTEWAGGSDAGCARKWALKYTAGLPDPSGPAADFGKEVHSLLELWMRDGILPKGEGKTSKLARAMLKHLPPPPQPRTEEAFTFELEGVKYRGFKDLCWVDGEVLVVTDYKTTSSLDWAKSEETLRRNTQALLYARHAFQDADRVSLFWLYGTRETHQRVLPVRFEITFSDVVAELPPITATGKRILELYAAKPDPNTLEPNLSMCDAYGGCPYKQNGCSISAADRIRAGQRQHNLKQETKEKMGFRDRIQKTTVDTVGTSVPDPPAPVAAAKPTMRERLGVAPPPFTKPIQTTIMPTPAPAAPEPTFVVDGTLVDLPAAVAGIDAAALKRRGRKPGSKNKPKDVADGAEVFTGDAPDTIPAPAGGDFVLCVNCFPACSGWVALSDFIRPVLDGLHAREGVADYRLIDYKAAGMLAAALYSYLECNPIYGTLVVDVRTDEGRTCLPTLERFAREVYRGF